MAACRTGNDSSSAADKTGESHPERAAYWPASRCRSAAPLRPPQLLRIDTGLQQGSAQPG